MGTAKLMWICFQGPLGWSVFDEVLDITSDALPVDCVHDAPGWPSCRGMKIRSQAELQSPWLATHSVGRKMLSLRDRYFDSFFQAFVACILKKTVPQGGCVMSTDYLRILREAILLCEEVSLWWWSCPHWASDVMLRYVNTESFEFAVVS